MDSESNAPVVRLISARSQTYRGRALRVGDSFEATEEDAADLLAIRYASRDSNEPTATPSATATKRQYRRRDMRADE